MSTSVELFCAANHSFAADLLRFWPWLLLPLFDRTWPAAPASRANYFYFALRKKGKVTHTLQKLLPFCQALTRGIEAGRRFPEGYAHETWSVLVRFVFLLLVSRGGKMLLLIQPPRWLFLVPLRSAAMFPLTMALRPESDKQEP